MIIYSLTFIQLVDRLQEEKRLEQIKRKERNEAYLFMTVNVLFEDSFDGHQGNDLYDQEKVLYRIFRVRKQATLLEFHKLLSDSLVNNTHINSKYNYIKEYLCYM
jgi:ubiquitin carboxyl-terminal hydrolase 7